MTSEYEHNSPIENYFSPGMPVTVGRDNQIHGYGKVKEVTIDGCHVVLTDYNNQKDKEVTFPISDVFAMP